MYYSCSMKHPIVSFLRIIVNLLALSHILTFSNSVFKIIDIFSKFVPSMRTDVASANNIENSRSDDLEKSFM